MDDKHKCKSHSKDIEIICMDCKSLLCIYCLKEHSKNSTKDCKSFSSLYDYGKELLLDYENQLVNLEKEKDNVEKSAITFASISKRIKEGLIIIKDKVELLLDNIKTCLDLFDRNEDKLAFKFDSMKCNIVAQCENLKVAIRNEDMVYIINQIDKRICSIGINDTGSKLAENFNLRILNFIKSKEIDTLNLLFEEFNSEYQKFSENFYVNVKNKFIYGACNPLSQNKVLCKYNIKTKKLIGTISIPQYAAVIEVGGRVFISGGYNPVVPTLSEFIEETQSLITKEPMKNSQYYHGVQNLLNSSFVAIGGYNNNRLNYCEEYLIAENKWRWLPSLHEARCKPAVAFLRNRYLYAIGGENSESTIEMLDLTAYTSWVLLNLKSNELVLSYAPISFPISSTEVMILTGDNKNTAGIFNTSDGCVKKHPFFVLADCFPGVSASVIRVKVYILGYNGNMHIYDLHKKTFEEIEYSKILP